MESIRKCAIVVQLLLILTGIVTCGDSDSPKNLYELDDGVKFDNVVAIDSGSSDGDSAVNRLMTAAPGALVKFLEQMKAATGIDLAKKLQEITDAPDENTVAAASQQSKSSAKPAKSGNANKE